MTKQNNYVYTLVIRTPCTYIRMVKENIYVYTYVIEKKKFVRMRVQNIYVCYKNIMYVNTYVVGTPWTYIRTLKEEIDVCTYVKREQCTYIRMPEQAIYVYTYVIRKYIRMLKEYNAHTILMMWIDSVGKAGRGLREFQAKGTL